MVSPSTNDRPISFIACPTAVRTTGSPSRRTIALSAFAGREGSSSSTRPVSISPHVAAFTRLEVGMPQMRAPVRRLDLVGDQLVDRLGVGHTQQRLREAHEPDALVGREPKFGEERLHHGRR